MTPPYDSSPAGDNAELISDLVRSLPLEEGLARILGAVPAAGSQAAAPAHQDLVDALATAMPPDLGLARVLAAETGPAALHAELTMGVDVPQGLAAILAGEPGTDASTPAGVGESSGLDDALLAIYQAHDGQRLLLRDGPAWPVVRDARRSLDDIQTLVARALIGEASRPDLFELMPEFLAQQHARVARAGAALATALSAGSIDAPAEKGPGARQGGLPGAVGLLFRAPPPRNRFSMDEPADAPDGSAGVDDLLEPSSTLRHLVEVAREDLQVAAQEFSVLEKSDPWLRRDAERLAAVHPEVRAVLSFVEILEEERDLRARAEHDAAKAEQLQGPHDDGATHSPDVVLDDKPHDAAGLHASVPMVDATTHISPPTGDAAGRILDTGAIWALGQAATSAGEAFDGMPGALREVDRDATRRVADLIREIAADLDELTDRLRIRSPAPISERLLRRCTVLVADLSVALGNIWAALSDFRGANLRDVTGVDPGDLDGVRWSVAGADTGATQWPDTLRDWVSSHSTPVDDAPGVFEIRYGAAVSTPC